MSEPSPRVAAWWRLMDLRMGIVPLPVAVDFHGEADAQYADGMLIIAIPLTATAYLPTTRTEIRMIVKRTLA